jgi:maltooligosyltrehalose trehalohydrolase
MPEDIALGAVVDGDQIRFRVWAPDARVVELETYPSQEDIVRHPMLIDDQGVWSATISADAGLLYRYRINEEWGYPDPYSRSQPEGVHGPSQVVDQGTFDWSDAAWSGLDRDLLVVYELHVGAYTKAGTFEALIPQLESLAELGVIAIELMPVIEFPGRRNWGYDGVSMFAPSSVYGGPEGLRRLVDAAHNHGLGVMLDVVYNHLGPDGNYLSQYSDSYFTGRYQTPWGDALNFDGGNSAWTRRLVLDSASMWFDEYHIDGLRLDATQEIYDHSEKHILRELAETASDKQPRPILIAEHERSDLTTVRDRESGGYGLDAVWVDDFHHSSHVLLTGESRGYLDRFDGGAEELAGILKTGSKLGAADTRELDPKRLELCLQNHDQVGNRPQGERLSNLVGIEQYKAAYTLLLLSPYTPLIFMGDEFAASTPFLFFTDHKQELAEQMVAGRKTEFAKVWGEVEPIDSQAETTFDRSKLDLSERDRSPGREMWLLFNELIALRKATAFGASPTAWAVAENAVAMLQQDDDGALLVIANFKDSFETELADHVQAFGAWEPVLCSAEERFAGPGVEVTSLTIDDGGSVELPARSAVVWRTRA